MQTKRTGVIGVGYEGISIQELVGSLRSWGVSTLVDVRLNAISRKAGFSKKALGAMLKADGIEYIHLPELGNPRENRSGYSDIDGEVGRKSRAIFSDHLQEAPASAALRSIAELAQREYVAVFCYEESELACHRKQVLDGVRRMLVTAADAV